jgi:hypothetical protein
MRGVVLAVEEAATAAPAPSTAKGRGEGRPQVEQVELLVVAGVVRHEQ